MKTKIQKALADVQVGETLTVCGMGGGFTMDDRREVTQILVNYDGETGEAYNVICFDDWEFDTRTGCARTCPTMYYI